MPDVALAEPPTRVISEAANTGLLPSSGNLVISVATAADEIVPWHWPPRERDLQLRAFWPTEDLFAAALFTIVAQYVSFSWSLIGPPRMVKLAETVLNRVQFGGGWEALMTPFLIDWFTTENGAFMEVVRTGGLATDPVISLNHLDSCRCFRTGSRAAPVIYIDLEGRHHELAAHNVISMVEMPSPIEEARGIGYCALTRVLRTCQVMRDISVVKQEKASGRFTRQIHLVSGVQTRVIEDAKAQKKSEADTMGLTRYIEPLVIASLDPTARVSLETINLASIPDEFDDEKSQRAYILALAMAFGVDYQSLAPLTGGSLGSSGSQSKMQNMKSRGKGPALFMTKLGRLMNFHGLLPGSVTFKFGEHDIAEQMEKTELRRSRALEREIRVRSGEITTEVARQLAVDEGDLDPRYLIMMHEANATQDVTATSVEPLQIAHEEDVKPGMPGPSEPPQSAQPGFGSAPNRPVNSNQERVRPPTQDQRRTPGGTPPAGTRA